MSAHDALDPDHSALLSDAAIAALHLHHQPFSSQLRSASAHVDTDADATALPFSDAIIEEQLADIKQALITGDDLLLILGEKGSGKTTLLQQLSANSGLRIQCFSVTGSDRFSTLNLFAGMLEAFQQSPPQKLKDVLDELTPCLQSMAARNTLSVVVLDDAHKVNQSELTQLLSGMLYMNSQDDTLVRVALAATSEFEDLIPELLPEGADMPYSSLTIEGFSPQRAAAYLDYRLGLAGFDQEFPFSERDMASLVDHSDGRPSELHALTADVLNEKYGRLEESVPQELLTDIDEGFLSSRKGKFALGIAATVLILGGLLMFLPEGERQDRQNPQAQINVAEQDVTNPPQTPELAVIEPEITESDSDPVVATDPVSDTAADSSSQNVASESTVSDPIADTTDTTATQVTDSTSVDAASDTENPVAANPEPDPEPIASTENADGSNSDIATSTNDPENAESSASEAVNLGDQTLDDQSLADASNISSEEDADTEPADQSELSELPVETQEAAPASDADAPSETAAETESTSSVDPELDALLESPNWILVQDSSQYTIQMSASRDLTSVENFLRRNALPAPNSIFSFEREGDIWYALVHGIYPTFSDAQRAVETMSDSAQRDQPWIRSVARVKEILRVE